MFGGGNGDRKNRYVMISEGRKDRQKEIPVGEDRKTEYRRSAGVAGILQLL